MGRLAGQGTHPNCRMNPSLPSLPMGLAARTEGDKMVKTNNADSSPPTWLAKGLALVDKVFYRVRVIDQGAT